jgi:hypothetical protein
MISMAIVSNLVPVLFILLRGLYDLLFSNLGTFVLINFITQVMLILSLVFY